MRIPSLILRQLYTFGSLKNDADGFRFSLKNRLGDATVTGILGLGVDGHDVPVDQVMVDVDGGPPVPARR